MNNQTKTHIAAVILAAGKGKRMQMDDRNKVTVHLAEKPLIQHTVDFMHTIGIEAILVVVGYHKESVIASLEGQDITFVEQKEQLGTGDALKCAMEALPEFITDVVVAYGDDAILYSEKNIGVIEKLFTLHEATKDAVTFLTIEQQNPSGLGRIIRDDAGNVCAIVEEKDATDAERIITEINPGCFVFSVDFLKEFLSTIEKSPVTGEYYLTSLIDLAIKNGKKVDTLAAGTVAWRGVNTKEELQEAEKLYNRND